jgi:hypothetical protein
LNFPASTVWMLCLLVSWVIGHYTCMPLFIYLAFVLSLAVRAVLMHACILPFRQNHSAGRLSWSCGGHWLRLLGCVSQSSGISGTVARKFESLGPGAFAQVVLSWFVYSHAVPAVLMHIALPAEPLCRPPQLELWGPLALTPWMCRPEFWHIWNSRPEI